MSLVFSAITPWITDRDDLTKRAVYYPQENIWNTDSYGQAATVVSTALYAPQSSEKKNECTVVGCSWELLHKRYAEEIDSNEFVIRVGDFYSSYLMKNYTPSLGVFDPNAKKAFSSYANLLALTGAKIDMIFEPALFLYGASKNLEWNKGNVPVITYLESPPHIKYIEAYVRARPNAKVMLLSYEFVELIRAKLIEFGESQTGSRDDTIHPTYELVVAVLSEAFCQNTKLYGYYMDMLNTPYRIEDTNSNVQGSYLLGSYLEWEFLKTLARVRLVDLDFHDYLYRACPNGDVKPWFDTTRWINAENTVQPGKTHAVCALVAHAPSLFDQPYGSMIDGCDAVIRTNNHFPDVNLVKWMGTKTTYLLNNDLIDKVESDETKFVISKGYELWQVGSNDTKTNNVVRYITTHWPTRNWGDLYFQYSAGIQAFTVANSIC